MKIEPVEQMPKPKTLNTGTELLRDPLQRIDTEAKKSMRVQQADKRELRGDSDREASREYDKAILKENIDKLNKVMLTVNPRFEFKLHEETNRILVRVWDTETNELIKEIPPEQILDIVASIREMVGLLIDRRL
jgi:flagellar protein FlaG